MCVEVALQCGSDWFDRVHAAVADGVQSEQKPEVMSPRATQADCKLFSMSGDPPPSPFKATPNTAHAPSSRVVCDCDPSKTSYHICDPESSGLFFTAVPSKSCAEVSDSALSEEAAPSTGQTTQERERLLTSQNHWLKSTLIKVLERYSQQLSSNKRQRQLMTRLLELRKQKLNSPSAKQYQQYQQQQQLQQQQQQQLELLHNQRQELYGKYEHLVRKNSQLERALKQAHRQAALAPPPSPQPARDELAEYRAMVKLQITSAVEDYRAEKAEKERALQLNAQLHQRVEELTRELQLLQQQQRLQLPAVKLQSGGRQPAAASGSRSRAGPALEVTAGHLWNRQRRSPLPPPGHPPLRYTGSLPSPRQPPEPPQSVVSRSVDEILAAPYQPVHVFPPPEPPPYDEVQIDVPSGDRYKMVLVDPSGRPCRGPARLPRTPEEVSESSELRTAAAADVEERSGRRSAVDLLLDQSLPEQLPPPLLDEPAAVLQLLQELAPPAAAAEERRAPQAAATGPDQQGRRLSTVRDSGYSESQVRGEEAAEAAGAVLRGWRPSSTMSALTDVSGGLCESAGEEASWRTGAATQLSGEYRDINGDGVENREASAHLIRTNNRNSWSSHVRTSPSGDNRVHSKRDGVAYYPSEARPVVRGASSTRDSFISAMSEWTVVGDSLLPATLPGRSQLPATLPEGSPEPSGPPLSDSPMSSKLPGPADISVDEYMATNTHNDVICPHCGCVFTHTNNLAYLDHIEVCPVRRVVSR